jgi:membrane associated rhomboid family serine protease
MMQVTKCAFGFAALTIGLQCDEGLVHALQFSRPVFEQGAVWQLFTSQWVHLNWLHAALNVLGAILILLAFTPWVGLSLSLMAWLGGYVGVAVVLWWDWSCSYYAGASGALHGLYAGCAFALVCHSKWEGVRPRRPIVVIWGALAGSALMVKLTFQHGSVEAPEASWLGFITYYPAHPAGALGGVLAVLLWAAWRTCRFSQAPSAKGQA